MKVKEKKRARELRRAGWSVGAIAQKIRCSKSSISNWVWDIPLTAEQIEQLKSNQDRGRAKAARHPRSSQKKWENIRNSFKSVAKKDIPRKYTNKLLKIVGASLYWAEGYAASRNSIIFANTDPNMIKLMMLFFRKVCKVPNSKFRGKISIHPHLNIKGAERYWSKISNIPLKQFNKPLLAISRSSQGKRDTLPVGTFRILIGDVYTCSKIKGWIEGLADWSQRAGSSVG